MIEDPPPPDKPAPLKPVLQNQINTGQIISGLLPNIGIIILLLQLVWTAARTETTMQDALTIEKNRALAAETALQQKLESSSQSLAQKIDTNAQITDQKLGTIDNKLTDLGDTVKDIVKASTPTRR